ncbi:MAG: outer membrane beta-barrel protein, partial [bacterium]|nr:outer membrane beta-barrel protein [bacterium]
MKKLLTLVVALALVSFAQVAKAQTSSELELSGNVTTVVGYERQLKGSATNAVSPAAGLLTDGLGLQTGFQDDVFLFAVDQVELDLAKSFGENIRLRADLDFSPVRAPAAAGVYTEQAYVTANVPVGNGVEFLVGRFNSGIGFDPVDRNELKTVSFSMPHRVLLPNNLTGARLGYQATDALWFDLFVVNNLQDAVGFNLAASSAYPSGGLNVKYSWGDEDAASWAKLSLAGGPEDTTAGHSKHFTFLGDLSGNVAVSDAFSVGASG